MSSSARWPLLTRLGALPGRMLQTRRRVRGQRAALIALCVQLVVSAALSLVAAARPYEGLWLTLTAATWVVWLWPFGLSLAARRPWQSAARRALDSEQAVARVAAELDRLNPTAPDVFRTALHPDVHPEATRDALEILFAPWNERLVIPAAPRVLGSDRAGLLRRAGLVLAVASFLMAAFLPLLRPAYFGGPGAGLTRMLLPLRALAAIPAPRLTPRSWPERVVRGDTLFVDVDVAHVPDHRPVHARVRVAGAGRDREVRYELTRAHPVDAAHNLTPTRGQAPQIRRFRFGPVTEDLTVRFTALEFTSRAYDVEVVTRPHLKNLSVVVTPPGYSRLPTETFETAPTRLAVLPGSRVTWRGTIDRTVQSWALTWSRATGGDSKRQGETVARGDGDEVSWTRTVRAEGALALTLTDRPQGGGGVAQVGPWPIDLRADALPEIVLLSPTGDGDLPRALKVPLVFRATDDFGISAVRVHHVWRDVEGRVRGQGVRDVSRWRDPRDGHGGGVWDGRNTGAAPVAPLPGETVELSFEAVDNDAVSGPKRARSATIRLRLPSAEEVKAEVSARERDATTSLNSALEREKRVQREAATPHKGQTSEAPPLATEWDVKRILSDEPRRHVQELKRQLEAEIKQANAAAASKSPASKAPASKQPDAKTPATQALEALKKEVEGLEKRLPAPEIARAPVEARQRALENLTKDQKALEQKLKNARPPEGSAAPKPLAQNRERLEADLTRQLEEQADLKEWLKEQERIEDARTQREDAAARQQARAREDVEEAVKQLEEAMQKGLENGTIGPEVLEKMDRVRELLEEVLDEGEKERLRRDSGEEAPRSEDLQRAMRDMLDKKQGLKNDLERAIRMLETMRDQKALRELGQDMRALEEDQKDLAAAIAKPQSDQALGPDELAAEQAALEKRLDQAMKRQDALASQPSMKALKKESIKSKSQEARESMKKTREKLKQPKADRPAAKAGADLAAQKLAAAAQDMEKALASMDQGVDKAEVRAVLEETLEFTRWITTPHDKDDAQAIARVAKWLSARALKLAAAKPFESDALRRGAIGMTAYADALSTTPDSTTLAALRRNARSVARELLKWLSDSNGGGGSDEGDGQGESDFGGGESGESGQEGSDGMASRMRGMSGQQMAANRMTQELLRELMQQRGQSTGRGQSGPGNPGGSQGGEPGGSASGKGAGRAGGASGSSGSSSGGPNGSQPGSGSSGGSSSPGGQQPGAGEGSGGEGSSSNLRGAAANAQQEVADALESLAEGADDAGGAARKLRQLADDARALERALRGGQFDPATLQKRQEQFRTRLLESADAMEERGQQQQRRAEAYRGGIEIPPRAPLPVDSLAVELRRRREDARRLPLTPTQKRRVEWYYERLLGE